MNVETDKITGGCLCGSVRWMTLRQYRYIFILVSSLSYPGFTSTMIYTVLVAMKTPIWRQRWQQLNKSVDHCVPDIKAA